VVQTLVGMDRPRTQYVRVGDGEVAYQTFGDGPLDLVYCYGLGNHVELVWEVLGLGPFFARLASFARVIFFDRRGTGASDGVPAQAIPTWEQWTEDLSAVLKASGSERAAILAALETGPIALLYAAMHPEVVSALVLLNTTARYLIDDDYPIGASPEALEAVLGLVAEGWGSLEFARLVNPSLVDDDDLLRRVALLMRASATPRSAAAQYRAMFESLDVRSVLPLVQAPTLVLHRSEDPFGHVDHGRYLAEHIEHASFVLMPGGDLGLHPLVGDELSDEVAEFLTGVRVDTTVERVLTTVLFSDIVGSTERAASLGDKQWKTLLDRHDSAIRDQLRVFRGREINTTGDGFVACFDGPGRAIRCAENMLQATRDLGLQLRIGLHTGECEVRGDDLGGLAVHIAARVGALAGPNEVLISRTVRDLVVGSGIVFEDRGVQALKGVPDEWQLFAVTHA
jgi:class 3 adenylate cyclase/alpha-beta hydrolase superfamily lysophospholipase